MNWKSVELIKTSFEFHCQTWKVISFQSSTSTRSIFMNIQFLQELSPLQSAARVMPLSLQARPMAGLTGNINAWLFPPSWEQLWRAILASDLLMGAAKLAIGHTALPTLASFPSLCRYWSQGYSLKHPSWILSPLSEFASKEPNLWQWILWVFSPTSTESLSHYVATFLLVGLA